MTMKTILLFTGCAAALILAGCASDNGANPAELPNVTLGNATREPNTATQYYDGSDYIGLTYAQMNKKLGQPVMKDAQTVADGVPAKAAYSQTKRLDIHGEVFYTKSESRTVTETHSPRFYETVTVVKATFDDKGVVSDAIVSSVDRMRTSCQVCSAITPCPIHGCSDGECVCPTPCGCSACEKNKALCYKMGCVPGEPCACCCGGSCCNDAD